MTFLNKRNVIVNNFSRLVIGYRRQTTGVSLAKIWQVESGAAPHKLGIYCFPNFYSEQEWSQRYLLSRIMKAILGYYKVIN